MTYALEREGSNSQLVFLDRICQGYYLEWFASVNLGGDNFKELLVMTSFFHCSPRGKGTSHVSNLAKLQAIV